jgi:hypothetical protein
MRRAAEEVKRVSMSTESGGRKIHFSADHPIRIIRGAYDRAIAACGRSDGPDALRAVRGLREAIRAAGPDAVPDLLREYDLCLEQIQAGDFNSARGTLTEMLAAWIQAEDRLASGRE